MKNAIVDRIAKLEGDRPSNTRILCWSDDDEDELATAIAKDREGNRFCGDYIVIIGVSGRWEERAGELCWVRPERAARRYVHAMPPMSVPSKERGRMVQERE